MRKLISFDIDGTLEVGDPPGLVTLDMVRSAKAQGFLIGSCSDRTISFQQQLWQQHHILVDFTVLKHQLEVVKRQFDAEEYFHIGDSDMDSFFAGRAGFHFVSADAAPERFWGSDPAA